MPHKPSQYDFDYCPTCGTEKGTPYLRQQSKSVVLCDEQHNPVAIETTYKEKNDINKRRSKMGMPPLDVLGLTEINKINEQHTGYRVSLGCLIDNISIYSPEVSQRVRNL